MQAWRMERPRTGERQRPCRGPLPSRQTWPERFQGLYAACMATAVKKLELHGGELIEVAGRRYEVVPNREGD